MQFHKIPQNVTRYQGRIIGKFTAHQFVYLAIGGIIIFIIFTTPTLSKQYKISLIGFIGLITALFAVVSYEGRSTDIWILTFLRVVATPTQRIWHKRSLVPKFLLPGTAVPRPTKRTQPKAEGKQLYTALQKESQKEELGLTQKDILFLKNLRQYYPDQKKR